MIRPSSQLCAQTPKELVVPPEFVIMKFVLPAFPPVDRAFGWPVARTWTDRPFASVNVVPSIGGSGSAVGIVKLLGLKGMSPFGWLSEAVMPEPQSCWTGSVQLSESVSRQ